MSPNRKKLFLGLFLVAALYSGYALGTALTSNQVGAGVNVSGPIFTFGAAGDFGFDTGLDATLGKLDTSGADFFIALGDLSYGAQPQQWCNKFKATFNDVELISGNHDDNEIDKFVQSCPFTLSVPVGRGSDPGHIYGYEYYFDYPAIRPIARFILISPAISFAIPSLSDTWNYTIGNAHYNFVRDTIDNARTSNIAWVVVAMHKVCISTGTKRCEIGTDLMNLLIQKKVDLVLAGHDHDYQRSKQLTCAYVGVFDPSCVADDGLDNTHTKSAGTIFVTQGVGGRSLSTIDPSDTEAGYFAKTMGSADQGSGFGFVKYTVFSDVIRAELMISGSFVDSFSIIAPAQTSLLAFSFLVGPENPGCSQHPRFESNFLARKSMLEKSWFAASPEQTVARRPLMD